MDLKAVFIQNEKFVGRMTIAEIEAYVKENDLNLCIAKSNGYSHIWTETVAFDKKLIEDKPDVYLIKKEIGRNLGTSEVSFS